MTEPITRSMIYDVYYALPAEQRARSEWVMSRDTFAEVLAVHDLPPPPRHPVSGRSGVLLGRPLRLDPAAEGVRLEVTNSAGELLLTEAEIDTLATYNTERRRGIRHTEEWCERMVGLQARFDAQFGRV